MKTQNSEHHFSPQQLSAEQAEIERAKKNLADFSVLYNRYYVRIFQYIFQRVKTEQQAADISSETFIKAMENLKSYKHMGLPFASWLFRIARNEVYYQHKINSKIRQVNFTETDLKNIAEDVQEVKPDKIEIIIKAIKSLTDNETEMIEMKYFEKRSYSEIGNILDISENNAKVKTFRVIQKLKAIIKPNSKI